MTCLVQPKRMKRSLVNGVGRGVLNGVADSAGFPRTGLSFYAPYPGLVDITGLSSSDYLLIRSELRSIFFSDPVTLRAAATIITNIQASPYLNIGLELVGTPAKGYALYQEATPMSRAYRYFGVAYYIAPSLVLDWADGGEAFVYTNEWADGGIYEYSI